MQDGEKFVQPQAEIAAILTSASLNKSLKSIRIKNTRIICEKAEQQTH